LSEVTLARPNQNRWVFNGYQDNDVKQWKKEPSDNWQWIWCAWNKMFFLLQKSSMSVLVLYHCWHCCSPL